MSNRDYDAEPSEAWLNNRADPSDEGSAAYEESITSPWVVECNGVVVCAVGMKLTRSQAENKVANERLGSWRARPATKAEINPPEWSEPLCED